MPNLPVRGLPSVDNGRSLVRLNTKYRGEGKHRIPRYGIAKITNHENQNSVLALVLGHDADDAIFMPFEIRTELGVTKGGNLDFGIEKCGTCRKLWWYITTPDPAIHIPAWIGIVGTIAGVVGIVLAASPK